MIGVDYSIIFQVINFLVLILILHIILYKPAHKILKQREDSLALTGAEREKLTGESQRLQQSYEDKRRQATQEALEEKKRLMMEGMEEAKLIINKANREIPILMADFHQGIEREIKEAREILKNRSGRIAVEVAERVLNRCLR